MNVGTIGSSLGLGLEFEPGRDRRGKVLVGRDGEPLSYQMPAGLGHYIVAPNRAVYGRYTMILFLSRLSALWQARCPHPFGLGDIGNADLSAVSSHADHAGGLSVDIYVMHKDGIQRSGFATNKTYVGAPTYDPDATIRLLLAIDRLRNEFPIKWWYFNEDKKKHPELQPLNFTRHVNHDDHVHIHLEDSHRAPRPSDRRWTLESNWALGRGRL